MSRALMRRPESLGEAVVSLIDRRPVDADLALAQWESLRFVVASAGWSISVVEPGPEDPPCPDGVFVGDAVARVGSTIVLARSAVESRVPERAAIRRTLARLGEPAVPIRRPGFLDCGDLVRVGDVVYVGVGSRTNRAGLAQVVRLAARSGMRVVPVPLHKAVQLTSAVTGLPCGTVLGFPPFVDDPSVFRTFVPVPEAAGTQVLHLGGQRLLVSTAARRTLPTLRHLGYEPIEVDISEFEKREGSITCLLAPF